MSLQVVTPGEKVPDLINVIIEIPANSPPVKYEVDKVTGAMFVDRFISTPMFYPCNYGYIPQTLSADGDPCDVLVVTPVPLIVGAVIEARPIGMLKMSDESGEDAKIVAVPKDKLCQDYRDVHSIEDLPKILVQQIEHFFTHYKDLEPNKWVKIEGWADMAAAKAEVVKSMEQHATTS